MPRYIGHSIDSTDNKTTDNIVDTDTKLLLDFNNNLTDRGPTGRTMTSVNSAAASSTQTKFGSHSLSLNGSNQYLTAVNSADFRFGSGDFTIECWIYPTTVGRIHGIATQLADGARGWFMDITAANKLRLYGYVGSWQELGISTTSVTVNNWHHCAVTRDGNNFRVFLNGVLEDTTVVSGSFTEETSNVLTVGYALHSGVHQYLLGFMDDFRITKGSSRYTATFAVPTAAHGTRTNNVLRNSYNSGVWSIGGTGNESVTNRIRSGIWAETPGVRVGARFLFGGYTTAQFNLVGGTHGLPPASAPSVLNVVVGGGGFTTPAGAAGGGGGGYSGIFLGPVTQGNALAIAGGGGGGSDSYNGGSPASPQGGTGGAGGGTEGAPTAPNPSGLVAGGGTQSAGGARAGSPPTGTGTAGTALQGGHGTAGPSGSGSPNNSTEALGGGGQGRGGGPGETPISGGGGGGGGYFGGGGGHGTSGRGGGGGSGFIAIPSPLFVGSSNSSIQGSGNTVANAPDPQRGTAGQAYHTQSGEPGVFLYRVNGGSWTTLSHTGAIQTIIL
jgi:hypothetical protein